MINQIQHYHLNIKQIVTLNLPYILSNYSESKLDFIKKNQGKANTTSQILLIIFI